MVREQDTFNLHHAFQQYVLHMHQSGCDVLHKLLLKPMQQCSRGKRQVRLVSAPLSRLAVRSLFPPVLSKSLKNAAALAAVWYR
jgi:hypothetical protein